MRNTIILYALFIVTLVAFATAIGIVAVNMGKRTTPKQVIEQPMR